MRAADENGEQEYGLVLQETEKAPKAVMQYLRLLLNYRYGMELLVEKTIQEALVTSSKYGSQVSVFFYLKDQPIENRNQLIALGKRGQIPLFLLVPQSLVDYHKKLCSQSVKNVLVMAWEEVLNPSGLSLPQVLGAVFEKLGIGRIDLAEKNQPQALLQGRLERRLQQINTLPTLPEIVLRLTRLLSDPSTQIEDLEELLLSDPAIVHRILQIVNSPLFAGRRTNGEWTLREAVVRLGLKQVGVIAQQIKLINSLVKPKESPFNIRRFWEHSVGVAVIADKLYVDKLLPLKESISVDRYWVGGLLHDVGKMVMGFFFWENFKSVIERTTTPKTPFHWAEERLKIPVTHEQIGRLVMLRAKADPQLVAVVGAHNNVGRRPDSLACLIHVADNLSKDLGLGYLEKERSMYSPSVLDALGVTEEELNRLGESVGERMRGEIEDLVNLCLGR